MTLASAKNILELLLKKIFYGHLEDLHRVDKRIDPFQTILFVEGLYNKIMD